MKRFPKLKYEKEVMKAYAEHSFIMENSRVYHGWSYGHPVRGWYDKDGNLCVKYESGDVFHYEWSDGELKYWQ